MDKLFRRLKGMRLRDFLKWLPTIAPFAMRRQSDSGAKTAKSIFNLATSIEEFEAMEKARQAPDEVVKD